MPANCDDLLEHCPDAIVVLDPEWHITYVNRSARQAAGRDCAELIGKRASTAWPEFIDEQMEQRCRPAMEARAPVDFECETVAGLWADLRVRPCAAGIVIYFRDATKRKRAELVHREREADLFDFLKNAAIPIHSVGADGTILWANDAELQFLGYSASEYVGRNISEFHADGLLLEDILKRLKSGQQLHDYEARLRCKDGSIRHVAISSNASFLNGEFAHTRCFTRDIGHERLNQELHERLAAIVESSGDAIIGKDLDGMIRSWNRGAERIFGYTAAEAIGQPVSILTPADHADELPGIMARIENGDRIEPYQTLRRAKDGRIVSVSVTVSPIRDAAGKVRGASKVARDISAERRYGELQEHLAAIVESSDDAIISKDLSGIIRSWNRGAERIFGYTAAETVGQPVTMLAAPDRTDEIPNIIQRISRGERIDHYQTKRRAKDGRILSMSLTVSPVRDSTGKIVGASKIARDITEQERNREALRHANELLKRSNSDLEHFAYSASHDLQEPLRMVAVYSEMLLKRFGDQLGAEADEFIGYVINGALRMEQLLKDLRVFTQVSTMTLEPPPLTDANEVLRRSLENLSAAIEDAGASISSDTLPFVRLHEFQLGQLFQNLIGNAMRYRSAAPPLIHVGAERNGRNWRFSVRDNGIGIEPEYKEHIFGMFKRLHGAAQYPGTGMGLAICQRIVERTGGQLWVDSTPGGGSTFFFTIPTGSEQEYNEPWCEGVGSPDRR
ncbi:MAG: sensor signal transduction histidine kinase [Candidatus Solibacter sp.]|nr:sensor signal transduction histidine kinase [Candidatus Solibacter sp.]